MATGLFELSGLFAIINLDFDDKSTRSAHKVIKLIVFNTFIAMRCLRR